MSNYCTRQDVERHWGTYNVSQWADLNNDSDETTVQQQIQWAILTATNRINTDLSACIYVVPFPTTPVIINHYAASLAGIYLFKSRMMAATEGNTTIEDAENEYKEWVVSVYSGMPIVGATIIECNS